LIISGNGQDAEPAVLRERKQKGRKKFSRE
jgi:hypothetical protein